MTRFLIPLGMLLLALCGCSSPVSNGASDPNDYANWPELTKQRVQIDPVVWRFCAGPPPALVKQHGPHFVPAIRVHANDLAASHIREERPGPLPVGAIVVKVKLAEEKDTNPSAYAAMIKRDAGYDPDHGDWEYVYVEYGEKTKTERGKMASCIDCHKGMVKTDYLFLTYMKAAE